MTFFSRTGSRFGWTFAITSSAWFVFALDRLAVTTALPAIRTDLSADLTATEWTVGAYTLSFAVLLLAGAALGDRFGRRRMFAAGMALFAAGSAGAALAPTVAVLVAARALQGAGGAIFAPLALTMLTAATPVGRRGAVLGAWGGIGGLGAAVGPLAGGALTNWVGWQWIFWLNVPFGLALVPLALLRLAESRGPHDRLDVRGVALSGAGMFGVVWAVTRAGDGGWTHVDGLVALVTGALLLTGFVAWQRRTPSPMLPMHFFRSRGFTTANLAALAMYAALFGSLFLFAQLLQTGLGASPLEAGLRLLPMAVMPMVLAPLGGALSDRWGTRPLMVVGVGLVSVGLAWMAAVVAADVSYGALVVPMVMMGGGSALFFAPVAATVLGAVEPHEQGQASGATTTVRELAVVLGVAALGSVFAAHGSLQSPAEVVSGVVPALWVASGLAGVGVLAALALPGRLACHPNATQVVVRTAHPEERAAIQDLLAREYAQYIGDIAPEAWPRYRADLLDLDRHSRNGLLLVATRDCRLAGYAAFYPDASAQGLGWPAGWAGGRGLAVHSDHRGHGVAAALMLCLEQRARASGASVFAFHTSSFMTTAMALYERLGYRRAHQFDRDLNAHYGVTAAQPWTALAYLKPLQPAVPARQAAHLNETESLSCS